MQGGTPFWGNLHMAIDSTNACSMETWIVYTYQVIWTPDSLKACVYRIVSVYLFFMFGTSRLEGRHFDFHLFHKQTHHPKSNPSCP